MERREFISMLGAGAASLAAEKLASAQAGLQSAGAGTRKSERPNFILIYPDSMGAKALGCYGNAIAKTPTMDALAAGGVRFAECTSQNPLCFPSRACLHTGKYVEAHGCRDNGVNLLDPVHPTFARMLQAAGYRTGYFGKTHN